MNEETFVEQLSDITGPDSFLGDDCAVLNSTGETVLVTVDTLSESIHFEDTVEPEYLMKKLVGVNVSDISAMGGIPQWALLAEGSLDDPEDRREKVRVLHRELQEYNVDLIGGDTSAVARDGSDYYSLTLLGRAHPKGVLERSNAQPGDSIYVTGSLGGPAAVRTTASTPWTVDEREVLYHPPDRVAQGQELVESGCRCAIDVSDGLIKDLNRILRRSGVGARLDWTQIPVDKQARDRGKTETDRLKWALTGGEEFELLYTLPADHNEPDPEDTLIGCITDGKHLSWDPPLPEEMEIPKEGYDHLNDTGNL